MFRLSIPSFDGGSARRYKSVYVLSVRFRSLFVYALFRLVSVAQHQRKAATSR